MARKCTDKFLRMQLWCTQMYPEAEQTEIVLRLACKKLSDYPADDDYATTQADKYIEKYFGRDVWNMVHAEFDKAKTEFGDVQMLVPEFAFGTPLVQDMANMGKIFGVNIERTSYRRAPNPDNVVPVLYKRGRRGDRHIESGLRNTYVCKSPFMWVVAEYTIYMNEMLRLNKSVDTPYIWYARELERCRGDVEALPEYLDYNGGKPKPWATKPDDITTVMKLHYRYMSGLYAVLCWLVTLRVCPTFDDDYTAKWHNVWYFGSRMHSVNESTLAQFHSLLPLEMVYFELMRGFTKVRAGREYKLCYKGDCKADVKIMNDTHVITCLLKGLESKDYRMGGDILEAVLERSDIFARVVGNADAATLRDNFRKVLRNYCYSNYVLDSLKNTLVRNLHGSDVAGYTLKNPELDIKGVSLFDIFDDSGEAHHRYLYVNDYIDGASFSSAVNRSCLTEPVKVIYIGTKDNPTVLVQNDDEEEIAKKWLVKFNYETREFEPLDDSVFVRPSGIVLTGGLASLMGDAFEEGEALSQDDLQYLSEIETIAAWSLINRALELHDAEKDDIEKSDSWEAWVRMPDIPDGNHATPFPMVVPPDYFKNNKRKARGDVAKVGGTVPLTTTRVYPLYAVALNMDSYYGLFPFGGLEILVDGVTDKALVFKKSSFLRALGVESDWIRRNVIGNSSLTKSKRTLLTRNSSTQNQWDGDGWEAMAESVKEKIDTNCLALGPVTQHTLRTHTISEIYNALTRVTKSSVGLWEVQRLSFRGDKVE